MVSALEHSDWALFFNINLRSKIKMELFFDLIYNLNDSQLHSSAKTKQSYPGLSCSNSTNKKLKSGLISDFFSYKTQLKKVKKNPGFTP